METMEEVRTAARNLLIKHFEIAYPSSVPVKFVAADWIIDAVVEALTGGMSVQQHALLKLIEESAEVTQRACKQMAFGADEIQKGQELTNKQRLTNEVLDFRSAALRCVEYGQLHEWQISDIALMSKKDEKVNKYLAYSVSLAMVLPSGPAAK